MYETGVKKRGYRGHKRRITACAECYRRKQKCNHESPCNICIARGVVERCVYGKNIDRRSSDDDCSTKLNYRVKEPDVEQERNNLLSQIGYSSTNTQDGVAAALNELADNSVQARPAAGQNILATHKLQQREHEKLARLLTELPSSLTCNLLIRIFFNEANWYFTVLDQYYFERVHRLWLLSQQSDGISKISKDDLLDVTYFPALLYQVLALAAQFVPAHEEEHILGACQSSSLERLSQKFSDIGEAVLNLFGRHNASSIAVQADLMRCAWCKNTGRGTEAWYSLGNAVRQAQDQGLHLEPKQAKVQLRSNIVEDLQSEWYNEHRRRIWVCLFTWESHMALQLGRPRMINASDCTIQNPIDSDIPLNPSRTLFIPASTLDKPSEYTAQIVKYVFAQKIHRIMSMGTNLYDYTIVNSIHAEVDQMLSELPAALRLSSPDTSWDLLFPLVIKHRLQIAIIANSFLLSLHRPYVATQSQSLRSAVTAALQVLNLSQRLFERTEKHQYKTFTLIFYTIDAGILLSAMAIKFPLETQPYCKAIVDAIREANARLSVLKERNSAAVAGEKVLLQSLTRVIDAHEKTQHSFRTLNHSDGMRQTRKNRTEPTKEHSWQIEESQMADTEQPFTTQPQVIATPNALPFSDSVIWGDQDIFSDTINDAAFTSHWLEHVNDLLPVEGGMAEDIDWNLLFQ